MALRCTPRVERLFLAARETVTRHMSNDRPHLLVKGGDQHAVNRMLCAARRRRRRRRARARSARGSR